MHTIITRVATVTFHEFNWILIFQQKWFLCYGKLTLQFISDGTKVFLNKRLNYVTETCFRSIVFYLDIQKTSLRLLYSSLHNIILSSFRIVLVLWTLLLPSRLPLSYVIVVLKSFSTRPFLNNYDVIKRKLYGWNRFHNTRTIRKEFKIIFRRQLFSFCKNIYCCVKICNKSITLEDPVDFTNVTDLLQINVLQYLPF